MARGYDNYVLNSQLLLDLQYREGTGTNTQDWAKPHHVCTLTGVPTWAALGNDLAYLDFVAANPDYVLSLAGVTADLNFTTGDFSGVAWIRPDVGGEREIFTRGVPSTDGWGFYYQATTNALIFYTNQAAAMQSTIGTTGDVVTGIWQLVGFTRDGAAAHVYVNGTETTATYATHVDPLTSARNLYIGTTNGAGAGWYDGDMYRPRIWSRCLSAAEMHSLFMVEHQLLGL